MILRKAMKPNMMPARSTRNAADARISTLSHRTLRDVRACRKSSWYFQRRRISPLVPVDRCPDLKPQLLL
eukprot:6208960-Pleurochrysis_carterae.AAC.2